EGRWLTDFEQAAAAAKQTGRPILADFGGSDWCSWCIRLKKEVFDTPEFRKWAGRSVVLLDVDFPRTKAQPEALKKHNAGLLDKYGIRSFPTVLFLDHEGKVLGRSGYRQGGPAAWIDHAKSVLGRRPATQTTWLTDFDRARALAKKTGRPILADFSGSDWCGWCIRLKREVFDTPAFKKWAAQDVVLLEVDFPRTKAQPESVRLQNRELMRKYGVRAFPTVLFLDHAGKVLGRSGYRDGGPSAWIEHARKIIG
ncbi:MAG: thioredoxin family protein, partial [Planctomycetota bacterium]